MANIGSGIGGAASGATAGAKIGTMIGGPAGTAIGGALGGIAGGIAGLFGGGDDEAEQAAEARAKARKLIEEVGMPPDQAKRLILEEYKLAGQLSPQMEQAIGDNIESEFVKIKEDAGLRKMQTGALEALARTGRTGLGAQERAAYNQLRQQGEQDVTARLAQIEQQAAMQGQGAMGNTLAAKLSAAQAGADRASAGGDRLAADAASRALEAVMKSGQLSGDIRRQDYDVASGKASAQDVMSKFRTSNQIDRQTRNVGRSNEAQAANLAAKQAMMDSNTGLRNKETQRQSDAQRQFWVDKTGRAETLANLELGDSNRLERASQNKNQGLTTTLSALPGIAEGASKIFGKKKSDDDEKDDLLKGVTGITSTGGSGGGEYLS